MRPNGKTLGAIAFTLALAGGGVAGALLGMPGSSGAQDSPTSTTEPSSNAHPGGHGGPEARGPGEGLAAAAKAIGISEADLHAALQGGQSIAEVAADHGVDEQTVIDAMVAAAKDHLESEIAALPDRVKALVDRKGPAEGGPRDGRGPGRPGGQGQGLDAAATAIGISADDLRTALQGGSTMAEVADAHHVDAQKVIDALVAETDQHLDDAVAAGHLTEAEAAQRKGEVATRVTAMVNGDWRGGRGPGGPKGHRPGPDAPADATT